MSDPEPTGDTHIHGNQTNITGNTGPVLSGTFYGPVNTGATTPTALDSIPAPVSTFGGRDSEVAELVKALTSGSGTVAISGVRGLGGIGKSQLAFAVAQQLAGNFPDGRLFIPLGAYTPAPLSAAQVLQRAIRAFHPQAQLPEDVLELAGLYRSTLSGKRVLVVADDAGDVATVKQLIPSPGCALLVTSRHRFSFPGLQALDLEVLSVEEAEALLLRLCPRIGEHAGELARLCGYLPLALQISAGLLATNDTWEVGDYLVRLEQERLKYLSDPDDTEASVRASLELSYQALPEEAQKALARVSVFPADFDRPAAAAIIGEGLAVDALDLLRRRCLLDWDEIRKRYRLHDLVRVFASEHLDSKEKEIVGARHTQYYLAILQQADMWYRQRQQIEGLILFDKERTNTNAGWAWLIERGGNEEIDALLREYASVTVEIGILRYNLLNERIPQMEAALAAARRCSDLHGESAWLSNLGLAFYRLGNFRQAVFLLKQSLKLSQTIHDQIEEGKALGSLGLAYYSLGNYKKALNNYKKSLTIARALNARRLEGSSLGGMGTVTQSLGDHRKAIQFFKQALMISRMLGDRHMEGNVLMSLGTAFHELGNFLQAIRSHEQALAIFQLIGDQFGEGSVLTNLGLSIYHLGDFQQTKDLYEQALAIFQGFGNRQGEARTSWNLAVLLVAQGDRANAATFFKFCVDYERSIGHPDADATAAKMQRLLSDDPTT